MKRINYAGDSLVTSSAVADALLEFATHVGSSVTVQIPVLEESGKIAPHTLLIGPASQLDVFDVDGLSAEKEAELFTVPDFPPVGGKAIPQPADTADELAASIEDEL